MRTEILTNSPVYKFLLATFRANPDQFIEQILNHDLGNVENDFIKIIQNITRNNKCWGIVPGQ